MMIKNYFLLSIYQVNIYYFFLQIEKDFFIIQMILILIIEKSKIIWQNYDWIDM
jgi:hypothetical protein